MGKEEIKIKNDSVSFNTNKIIQICDIDKQCNEQSVFINLAKIESISFIYSAYKQDSDGWTVPEYYNPPKVKLYCENNNRYTISYAEFEKYIKPYIENLNLNLNF